MTARLKADAAGGANGGSGANGPTPNGLSLGGGGSSGGGALLPPAPGAAAGAGPPPQAPLLVDEVPHVVSTRLKTSLADAGELAAQVEAAAGEIERELARAEARVALRLTLVDDDGGSGGSGGGRPLRVAFVVDRFVEVMSGVS